VRFSLSIISKMATTGNTAQHDAALVSAQDWLAI